MNSPRFAHSCAHSSRGRVWRRVRRTAALLLAAAAVVTAGSALAHGRGPGRGGPAMHAARLQAQLDDMMELAKATPEQRAAVQTERDRLVALHKPEPAERKAVMEEITRLLQAERIDPQALARLQAKHQSKVAGMLQGVREAVQKLHGVFRPDQRKAIAAYIRDELPSRHSHWRGKMARFFVERQLEEALGAVKATEAQKTQIRGLVNAAIDAEQKALEAGRDDVEAALRLFEAPRLDAAALAGLEQKQVAAAKARGERTSATAVQIHALLSADQRKALAAHLQAAAKRFGKHHGPGRGGPDAGDGPAD